MSSLANSAKPLNPFHGRKNMHTATVTMILTGPYSGKTKVLNGYLFDKGRCTVAGIPEQLAGVTRYFKSCYEVALDDAPVVEELSGKASAIISAALKIPFAKWDHTNADKLGPMPRIADMAPLVGRYDLTRQEMSLVFSQWGHLLAEHMTSTKSAETETTEE